MKAIGFYRYLPSSNPESLIDLDIPKPVAGGRDLLIHVKAISVNPADVKRRAPKDQVEKEPRVLGWDAAGIVEQVGPESTLFKPGDEVYYAGDIMRPGTNSEFHLVDERIVGHKPATLDFAHAAALPLTTLTAWEGLFDRLGNTPQPEANRGKSILMIGAAGGVGSIATQIAHWAGLTVIGTASRPETIQWAREHGADETIDHHKPFAPQLKQLGYPTVDYIFCFNETTSHWSQITAAIAPQGKICSIVGMDKPVDLNLLQTKSATFAWEWMFTRAASQTPDMIEQHQILNRVAELIDAGKLQSTLSESLSPITAAHLRQAHASVEKGNMIGKIVLEQFPD